MGAELKIYESHAEWLEGRKSYIGGSDAAAVIGESPWLSNLELWQIKTGRKVKPFKTNAAIEYGNDAEPLIRELFRLDHPELTVEYIPHNMWLSDKYTFAHASLDGWIYDEAGRLGVLEIKTGNVLSAASWQKWSGQIPNNYYCQVLHYLAITEAEFAIVKALLKGQNETFIREYTFDRSECLEDIEYLMNKEKAFSELIEKDIEPDLILNL